jgi:hypothetical protein
LIRVAVYAIRIASPRLVLFATSAGSRTPSIVVHRGQVVVTWTPSLSCS